MGSDCRNCGNELVTRCEVCRDDAVAKEIDALRTRLAACEEALRFAAHVLNNQVLKADSVLFQDAKEKVNAALKEPSRG